MQNADRVRTADVGQFLFNCGDVPLLGFRMFARIGVHNVFRRFVDHCGELVAKILAHQHLAALAVNDLALLVHDVVVFQDAFTRIEVRRLDTLLRGLDLPRNHAVFDRIGIVRRKP